MKPWEGQAASAQLSLLPLRRLSSGAYPPRPPLVRPSSGDTGAAPADPFRSGLTGTDPASDRPIDRPPLFPLAGATAGSGRHGTPSRSMAQHRISNRRAAATIAGFLRADTPVVSRA